MKEYAVESISKANNGEWKRRTNPKQTLEAAQAAIITIKRRYYEEHGEHTRATFRIVCREVSEWEVVE